MMKTILTGVLIKECNKDYSQRKKLKKGAANLEDVKYKNNMKVQLLDSQPTAKLFMCKILRLAGSKTNLQNIYCTMGFSQN